MSPLQKGPPDWTSCSSSDLLCPYLLRNDGAVSPVIRSVPGGNPLPRPVLLGRDLSMHTTPESSNPQRQGSYWPVVLNLPGGPDLCC